MNETQETHLDAPVSWLPDIGITRRSGLIACPVIMLGFAIFAQADVWRFALVGISWLFLGFSLVIERRYPWFLKYKTHVLVALVMFTQFSIFLTTGGLHSPMIIVVPLTCFFMSLVLDRAVLVPTFLGFCAILSLFITLEIMNWGDWTTLEVFALPSGGQYNSNERLTFGFGLVFLAVLATLNGVAVRKAYEHSVKESQRWQRHALEAREQRSQDLQRIAGALAHELKNPLTAIQGLSSFMADRAEANSDDAERLHVVVGETRRMRDILNRLLNVARPTHELLFEPTALNGILNDLIRLYQQFADSKSVTLEAHFNTNVVCVCDPRKVKQILINLIQNALEASSPNTTIQLHLKQELADECQVLILDEGTGLDADIENPFAPGVTIKPTGSGLGLSIARSLAAQHQGTIELSNRHDSSGCKATLTLPVHQTPIEN